MSELRQAPAEPDPRFWDAEARKLMLIDYNSYKRYTGNMQNYLGPGALGLAKLGFRVKTPFQKGSRCPITKAYGQRLINACRRLHKELNP